MARGDTVVTTPLIQLEGVSRAFPAGDETFLALKDVDLTIEAGEMIAIVGASGSGKSTLMNILGCLDRASAGSYRVGGRETGKLEPDELAELRREHFGFIFQRYHLLGDLSALANVEVPAIYAGRSRTARRERATTLLTRLGIADRLGHTPGKLSGGQQQRVCIARALMNGGEIILADEPTGALDTRSGAEVMTILRELHDEGHTVIIVSHDMKVAEHADRIIEISDGVIISDHRREGAPPTTPSDLRAPLPSAGWRGALDRFGEAFHMATLAMNAHRARTLLTMLGIIIGIASVVSVVALGAGSQAQILERISALGTNTIEIRSGRGFGDQRSRRVRTLVPADAAALAGQPYVDSVTPNVSTSVSARHGNVSANATVNGVGEGYFQVKGVDMARGAAFDAASVRGYGQDIVIDQNTVKTFFANGSDPLGQVLLLGSVPARVVGVAADDDAAPVGENLNVWAPYTTVMGRMLGQSYVNSITVRVDDATPPAAAEQAISRLLTLRHGVTDFFMRNTDTIRETIQQTTGTMTLLISAIAVISLVVGGIGVMNIMLVSVTERTREIGVRVAVGARRSDILVQFLIEAVLVCLIGGVLGIIAAFAIGFLFSRFGSDFPMIFSTTSIVAAFACSTLIGVVFGFLPARNAASLDPVEALARE